MTKKKNNPEKQQPQQQNPQELQPASAKRRPVIALVGLALLLMFLVSFIYRTQNQGLQVQRRAPQQAAQNADHGEGGSGMPAAMEQAMMGEIGKLMQQLQEKPDDVELLLQLAERFMTMQSWNEAETFLTRAMIAEPANLDVLYKLGIVNFEQQRPEDAAGYFEQIIALDPGHGHAQLNLGILYKHYLEKPQEARQRFEAVLQVEGLPQEMTELARKELSGEHGEGGEDAHAEEKESAGGEGS